VASSVRESPGASVGAPTVCRSPFAFVTDTAENSGSTVSANVSTMRGGAVSSTEPAVGSVRTRFGCAEATAGAASATTAAATAAALLTRP
jgi:hypothetical protein